MCGSDGTVVAGGADTGRPPPVRSVILRAGQRTRVGTGPEDRCRLDGVVLDLSRGHADLRLVLVDGTGAAVLELGPFPEEDVVAIWRSLASTSGLTPMMRAWNGRTEPLACQLGRLRLGQPQQRRRFATLGHRRPRFLVRRQGARLPARPLIYREREIASGQGA